MIFRYVIFPLVFLATVTSGLSDGSSFPVAGVGGSAKVVFFYRRPSGAQTGVLLLVPGYNGAGGSMLDAGWCRFADEHGLVLLAPTFQTNLEQLQRKQGYYYPEQGSGVQVETALAEVGRRTGVNTDKVLIFGFSAGAHFAHRFALWKPERVRAFVAYSAAWWSDPNEGLRSVPALIMCGEEDPRFEATRAFFEKAMALKLPWVWRSYRGTGHELTPAVRRMAEAFLAHCARQMKTGETRREGDVLYGDIQRYCVVPDADSIPEAVRIGLPSRTVGETWLKEN